MDDGLEMRLVDGYNRPVRTRSATTEVSLKRFNRICPGRSMRPPVPEAGAHHHPVLGSCLAVWSAHAADPEVRHAGASGGVLTALAGWLVEQGIVRHLVGAAEATESTRTVPVRITSREEALAAAGSRYAPVSNASWPGALSPSGGVIGKPCEAAAIRALATEAPNRGRPLLLSFFCAGTPSQEATDRLAQRLGVPSAEVASVRYRGHGWPGEFTVSDGEGRVRTMSYPDSWGTHLGPTIQWRCKICPDGVGEAADIVAGDFWEVDERGYPVFEEGAGRSALIARTPRGLELARAAAEAGVLVLDAVTPAAIAGTQPFQARRRRTLAGRLAGVLLAGEAIPRYRGYGLLRLALAHPRETIQAARGARRRAATRRGTAS